MKCKNTASVLIILLMLTSCKSKEDKALEIIKEDMFQVLYDFESYQPIETKIDSAFKELYMYPGIIKITNEISSLLKDTEEELKLSKSALESLSILANLLTSYGLSNYERSKYNYYLNENNEHVENAGTYLKKIDELEKLIRKYSKDIDRDFIGWKVTHKFRCKTRGGISDIATYIYVFDKDMKKVIYKEDEDDKELIKSKYIINEAINEKE